ncbi:FAD-dependent oxidoreductase [Bacillus testis]|uniref:FAD-dependent oxidoreductase n=1 Tax=Bacillus testis TaxID=1622072 RepID=UPI00067EA688|nr:FAD-dependent oxidoreductase [Bacillus testis]
MNWDKEYDVLVIGSGAAGFSAALTATLEGLETLLIEKESTFGGASALSGGGVWIPNNRYLVEAGAADSFEEAMEYMDSTIGDRTSRSMKETYLKKGIEMLDYFYEKTNHMRFSYATNYSDYYAHLPGGKAHGRSIEPLIFDTRNLKEWETNLKQPTLSTKGFTMTGQDFHKVNMITRTMEGKMRSLRLGMRMIGSKLSGSHLSSLGTALIARFALSYKEAGGQLWLNTAFEDFIIEEDRVVGIKVKKEGKEQFLKARKGVILGSGGFSRDQKKREKYLPKPTEKAWTSSPEGQTGDLIQPAEKLEAAFDLMDRVWGAPSIINHKGVPFFLVAERGIPSMIIVDQEGKRYLNEAIPYHEFVDLMYQHNDQTGGKAIPSWMIIDKRTKKRYLFGGQFPGQDFPKEYFEHGIVKVGETVEALASEIGIQPAILKETVDRFNTFARNGKDEDFGRGDNPYERYYGDPTMPNPNLNTLEKGPFYALRVYPGDIGTKGGVVIDESARILKKDGSPIKGVFAAGNCSASIMGETYPGPGATLGPGMTFGYIAAQYCTNETD